MHPGPVPLVVRIDLLWKRTQHVRALLNDGVGGVLSTAFTRTPSSFYNLRTGNELLSQLVHASKQAHTIICASHLTASRWANCLDDLYLHHNLVHGSNLFHLVVYFGDNNNYNKHVLLSTAC
eukprot:scpid79405/ scgid11788/ 